MSGVYQGYGFSEHVVNMSEPMPSEEMAKYWSDFINGHIPNFDLSPLEQIDNYVKECWEAIVETAIWAEKNLPQVLDEVRPDLVCRQRNPVSGDQTVCSRPGQTLGSDHLLLGKRNPGSGYSTSPIWLWRE